MSQLEIFATIITAIAVFLAGRNSIHTWWTGIIGCIAYAFIFYDVKLYSDVILQVFFLGTGIAGWLNWHKMKNDATPIQYETGSNLYMLLLVGIVMVAIVGFCVDTFTDGHYPFPDSAILCFSVIGQLLLVRRKIQTWYFWIVVNLIGIPVFWSRGLELTSYLYFGFLIHAFLALYQWKKLYNSQETKGA